MHKQYRSSIKARQLIRERSKPSTDKNSEHDNSIYYGDNVKFYWINCITSLLFLCKQFYNSRLKVPININFLIQLTIASYVLSISQVSVIMNLNNSLTNVFFTIDVLHITDRSYKLELLKLN